MMAERGVQFRVPPYRSEIILYVTEDGEAQIARQEIDGDVWLTQAQITDRSMPPN